MVDMRTHALLFTLALGVSWLACTPRPPAEEGPRYDGGPVSWHREVQPILQQRCQGCHARGGIAPFGLETYEEASNLHALLADSVQARRMPPWMPAEGPHAFRESRRLYQGEIDILTAWSEQGAPEGDAAEAPPPQTPAQGLAWVDLQLGPDAPYTPKAGVTDDYHCFLLEPSLEQSRHLIGFEVMPGVRQMVHHVLLFAAPRQAALDRDAQEEGPGWTCYGDANVAGQSLLGAWAPGTPPTRYPEGTGVRVAADSVIVMQVHYNVTQTASLTPTHGPMHGEAQPDLTRVSLQLSRERVKRPASLYPLINASFSIPPGAQEHGETVKQYVPAGTLWGVLPHMHTKGRRIQVELGADSLIEIPRWNFHWQQMYFYEEPVPVPLFSEMKFTCVWDNPTSRTVTWGEGTDDEMCLSYLYMTE